MAGPQLTDEGAPTEGGDVTAETEGDAFLRRVLVAPRGALPVTLLPDTLVDDTYRVIRRLGAGGMGVVYLAHDARLKRDVALKLHGAGTGERLEREATAIAQLVHPNVVTVYQIGRHDGGVYVAMEYVDGGTARAWLAEAPRPWRAVLAVYLDAARGLAAAHAAGMVHRDFKPENLLLGRDGRVRVADFGLARDVGVRDPSSEPSADRLTPLTATGAVMGTPAYMAPEQHQGGAVDAAADQFALCASLWEGLYGARPFAGDTAAQLAAAAAAGTIRAPADERGVPRPIRRALERGLAADPARRHPSMAALIDALAPRRSRAIALAAGGAALVIAAGVTFAAWPAAAVDPCTDAAAVVDREVPAAMIDGMRAAVAGAHGATDQVAALDARLARARPALADAAQKICRAAKVEHTLAPALVERAEACLLVRARATALLADDHALATSDPTTYATRLRAIPPLVPCLDPVMLSASPGRLDDRAIRTRALLWAASAELDARRGKAGRALIEQARATAAPDDRGAEAIALGLEGVLAYAGGKFDDALQKLTDAYYAGQALDDASVYLPALATLMMLYSNERFDRAAAAPWVRTAEAAIQKDRARAPVDIAHVLFALSAAADATGDTAGALRYAEQLAAIVHTVDNPRDLSDADVTLAHALAGVGRLDEAVTAYRRALAVGEATLGTSHPHNINILSALGLALVDTARLDDAAVVATRLEAALAASDRHSITRASGLLDLGAILGSLPDQVERATRAYTEARAMYVELVGEGHPDVLLIDGNLAIFAIQRGEHREAVAILERVLAAQEASVGADHPDVAGTLFNLAAAALPGQAYARAETAAARAAAIYGKTEPGTRRHVFALVLRSHALVELGRGRDALAIAREAERLAAKLTDDPESVQNASLEIARAEVALGRDRGDAARRLVAVRADFVGRDATPARLADVDALIGRAGPVPR